MTLTLAEATKIANREIDLLSSEGVPLAVLPDETVEFSEGWVFYYQSVRFLETGSYRDMVGGNAPVFVARSDGKSHIVSYHRPLSESMSAYRACGNPNADQIPVVRLTGWREGAVAVDAIKIVRRYSDIGLRNAKIIIDSCMEKQIPVVECADLEGASCLVSELSAVGFDSEILYDG